MVVDLLMWHELLFNCSVNAGEFRIISLFSIVFPTLSYPEPELLYSAFDFTWKAEHDASTDV